MRIIFFSLFIFSLLGCEENTGTNKSIKPSTKKNQNNESSFTAINKMERAHGKDLFLGNDAVKFDIKLKFGGKSRLDATIYMLTDSRMVRLDHADGTSIFFDGKSIWYNGESAQDTSARFDVLTWSYFFALPFKVNDPGTKIEDLNNNSEFEKFTLTFDDYVGDSPKDWYHLFIDKDTHLLDASGYIVTYGDVDVKKAEKNAHAIAYGNYKSFSSVQLATSWAFYDYKNQELDSSKSIGSAELSDIEFGTFNDTFSIPNNSHKVAME